MQVVRLPLALLALLGCCHAHAPCSDTKPCTGQGQVCNLGDKECVCDAAASFMEVGNSGRCVYIDFDSGLDGAGAYEVEESPPTAAPTDHPTQQAGWLDHSLEVQALVHDGSHESKLAVAQDTLKVYGNEGIGETTRVGEKEHPNATPVVGYSDHVRDNDKAEQVPMSVLMFGAVCLAVVILFGVLWGKNKKPEETNPQEVQQEAWAQMPHASLI